METVTLLIGGKNVVSGKIFERKNPLSNEVVSASSAATTEHAKAAVDAAAAALPDWAALAPAERRARLLRAADLLEARTPEFIALGTRELGGAPNWYGFNVYLAAGMLREAASMVTQISGEVIPSNIPGSLAMGIRRPAGVVLGIAPWNAPIILGVRAIAMPLACGNTVVFKGSEMCPAVHRMIGTVFEEAQLGPGVVNVILNAPEDASSIVSSLVADHRVRRINFTGSTKVGRIIAKFAAENLKPALLELGGKAPLLVLEDADLDDAVQAAAFGAFFNQGQICMSTERLIVNEKIADDFITRLAEKASRLRAGDPADSQNILACMVSCDAASKVKDLIDDAVRKGGVVTAGGHGTGAVMQPTVVDRVTPEMQLYYEESFGPVVAVVRVGDDAEAIRVANDSAYGLSAAIFSRDVARAIRVAEQIHSGICHINGPTVHDEAQMPFGGVKDSGYGRFGGKAAIDEFTELRWLTIQTGPRHYPI